MADLTVLRAPPAVNDEVGEQKPSFDIEVGTLI